MTKAVASSASPEDLAALEHLSARLRSGPKGAAEYSLPASPAQVAAEKEPIPSWECNLDEQFDPGYPLSNKVIEVDGIAPETDEEKIKDENGPKQEFDDDYSYTYYDSSDDARRNDGQQVGAVRTKELLKEATKELGAQPCRSHRSISASAALALPSATVESLSRVMADIMPSSIEPARIA